MTKVYDVYLQIKDWGALSGLSLSLPLSGNVINFATDAMAEHRAKSLSAFLSFALATGYTEIEPNLEPLKASADDPNRRQYI